jgi:hypothetical protein
MAMEEIPVNAVSITCVQPLSKVCMSQTERNFVKVDIEEFQYFLCCLYPALSIINSHHSVQ